MSLPQRLRAWRVLPNLSLLAGTSGAGAGNQLTIRVTNGPYAGSYQAAATPTLCFTAAARDLFVAAWIDTEVTGRAVADAGVEVMHAGAPGPKHGTVRVRFGKDGTAAVYQLLDQALTFTPTPQGARISAEGQTKDGIGLHLEAVCDEVEHR